MLCECGNGLFSVICMKNIGTVVVKCSVCERVKEISFIPHTTGTLKVQDV